MNLTIRPLSLGEYHVVESIIRTAGWSHTAEHFAEQHRWQADGFWLGEVDGVPAASIAVTRYVVSAWIGYLVVRPEFRRHGVGQAMMEHAIAHLRASGVQTIRLTASEAGARIYSRLGFQPEYRCLLYAGTAVGRPSPEVRVATAEDKDEIAALDWLGFGDDRMRLVNDLITASPETTLVIPGSDGTPLGYCLYQGQRLGPMVSSPVVAEALLDHALHLRRDQRVTIEIPEANAEAVRLLEERGFTQQGTVLRMVLGPDEPGEWQPPLVFATMRRANG